MSRSTKAVASQGEASPQPIFDFGAPPIRLVSSPVDDLIGRARAAANRGDDAAVEAAFYEVLKHEPEHIEALTTLARFALARGDAGRAVEFLRTAHDADPDNPNLTRSLGMALFARYELDEARALLEQTVARAPDMVLAQLNLGEVLEAQGRREAASAAYFRAIARAQSVGMWLDEATTPPWLRGRIQHAMDYAERGRAEVFAALLEPLRHRHGRDALGRIEKALAGFLGGISLTPPDARQQPRFLFIPDLPSQPFYPRERFPWLAQVEAAFTRVRAEALARLADAHGLEPFLKSSSEEQIGHCLGSGDRPPAWDAYFFYRDGKAVAEHLAACPETARLLEAIPLVRLGRHAPELCYSVLRPGTHILPHYGLTNARLTCHLPLWVPGECQLVVGGEAHIWREGRCVVFDDTFLHEGWNRSDASRVVLLLDAWHPDLDEAEREAISALVEGISEFQPS